MNTIKRYPVGLRTIMEIFDISPQTAISVLVLLGVTLASAVGYFIHSAPPSLITMSAGPEGSVYYKNATKYAKILEKSGVKVNILTSEGSLQNLERLGDSHAHVDAAFVQSGIKSPKNDQLMSLGSVSYQPLFVFYRHGGKILELLSELKGKKIAIGPEGSGTRNFALQLLEANGIKAGDTTQFLDWEAEPASKALINQQIDAAFIMSESASTDLVHNLLRNPEVELFNFKQANAYSRKIEYLNVLDLPEGGIDLGLNIPPREMSLVGPMVELVATKNLHPAISDLLLEAATEVHSRPGIYQHRGEFPAPIEHAIKISPDATRYFQSGKNFLYRVLPFWLASLASRIVVVFVPMLMVLIPALKSIPSFFRWRTQTKIRRRYRELLEVERDFFLEKDLKKQAQLRAHFDRIDMVVSKMSIPAAFADQFYGLRGHIDYVRQLLLKTDESINHDRVA